MGASVTLAKGSTSSIPPRKTMSSLSRAWLGIMRTSPALSTVACAIIGLSNAALPATQKGARIFAIAAASGRGVSAGALDRLETPSVNLLFETFLLIVCIPGFFYNQIVVHSGSA
ncbi:hypothetical protein ACFZAI_23775 [Achromobacter sp. NPDC008082]|uniref:hypothetical protein n=1 Tax=Achromobacter sp. NPDC008082 TaxID=3363888 RepID=UPI0036EBB3BE